MARLDPAPSAPVPIEVKFQDGGNYAIFVHQAGSPWSILGLVGEPPCPTRTGLPTSVQEAWHLQDICPWPTSGSKVDTATPERVSFDVPSDWTPTPYIGSTFDQSGPTGFVDVGAAESQGSTTMASCGALATDNALHPYGTDPSVQQRYTYVTVTCNASYLWSIATSLRFSAAP